MQTQENTFAVVVNRGFPFVAALVPVNAYDATARIALRLASVHPILLMRYFAQILDAIVNSIAVNVINLVASRVFAFAQHPNQSMRQITRAPNADANMTTIKDWTTGWRTNLYAAITGLANKCTVAHFKKSLQLLYQGKRLRINCHLIKGEVDTGQGVDAPLSYNLTTQLLSC